MPLRAHILNTLTTIPVLFKNRFIVIPSCPCSTMERNFIITGGARGFGKEFSKRVLEAGGRVVIADKNVEVGQETLKEFREVFSLNFTLDITYNVIEIWNLFLFVPRD